jgi:FkbM family methyltransferase
MIHKLKVLLAKILTSNVIGILISKLYKNKIPFYNTFIYTSSSEISPRIKASIFWKIYESSEVRFIKKYLNNNYDVIELGGSIGVGSVQIGKIVNPQKVITVEANPQLIPIIQNNFIRNGIQNFLLINCIISSSEKEEWFEFGTGNLVGKISATQKDNATLLNTTTLSKIIQTNKINKFNLVCDIEGAEVDLLINDSRSLTNCQTIIIETHKTTYQGKSYEPESIKSMLLNTGFKLIDQHGPIFVLSKINNS